MVKPTRTRATRDHLWKELTRLKVRFAPAGSARRAKKKGTCCRHRPEGGCSHPLSPNMLRAARECRSKTARARAHRAISVRRLDGGKTAASAGGHCTTRARLWAGQRSGALWRGCPGAPRDFWSKSVFLGGSGWKASLVRVEKEKCRPTASHCSVLGFALGIEPTGA